MSTLTWKTRKELERAEQKTAENNFVGRKKMKLI